MTVHLIEDMADAEEATRAARGDQPYEQYSKGTIVGTPGVVRERLQALVDAGIDYLIVSIPRVAYDQAPLRRFAREVIPLFA